MTERQNSKRFSLLLKEDVHAQEQPPIAIVANPAVPSLLDVPSETRNFRRGRRQSLDLQHLQEQLETSSLYLNRAASMPNVYNNNNNNHHKHDKLFPKEDKKEAQQTEAGNPTPPSTGSAPQPQEESTTRKGRRQSHILTALQKQKQLETNPHNHFNRTTTSTLPNNSVDKPHQNQQQQPKVLVEVPPPQVNAIVNNPSSVPATTTRLEVAAPREQETIPLAASNNKEVVPVPPLKQPAAAAVAVPTTTSSSTSSILDSRPQQKQLALNKWRLSPQQFQQQQRAASLPNVHNQNQHSRHMKEEAVHHPPHGVIAHPDIACPPSLLEAPPQSRGTINNNGRGGGLGPRRHSNPAFTTTSTTSTATSTSTTTTSPMETEPKSIGQTANGITTTKVPETITLEQHDINVISEPTPRHKTPRRSMYHRDKTNSLPNVYKEQKLNLHHPAMSLNKPLQEVTPRRSMYHKDKATSLQNVYSSSDASSSPPQQQPQWNLVTCLNKPLEEVTPRRATPRRSLQPVDKASSLQDVYSSDHQQKLSLVMSLNQPPPPTEPATLQRRATPRRSLLQPVVKATSLQDVYSSDYQQQPQPQPFHLHHKEQGLNLTTPAMCLNKPLQDVAPRRATPRRSLQPKDKALSNRALSLPNVYHHNKKQEQQEEAPPKQVADPAVVPMTTTTSTLKKNVTPSLLQKRPSQRSLAIKELEGKSYFHRAASLPNVYSKKKQPAPQSNQVANTTVVSETPHDETLSNGGAASLSDVPTTPQNQQPPSSLTAAKEVNPPTSSTLDAAQNQIAAQQPPKPASIPVATFLLDKVKPQVPPDQQQPQQPMVANPAVPSLLDTPRKETLSNFRRHSVPANILEAPAPEETLNFRRGRRPSLRWQQLESSFRQRSASQPNVHTPREPPKKFIIPTQNAKPPPMFADNEEWFKTATTVGL